MMDWKETTLNDVVTKLGDGLHGTPKYSDDGDYFFINGNNLSNGKIEIKQETKRCSQEEYEKYKKDLSDRTILVSINGSLGYFAYYNNEKCFLGKSACYFNIKETVCKEFIGYQIQTSYFQKYIDRLAGGTTIKNVSLKTMREFPFNLPPLPEQKAIANVLTAFDDKIDLLQQQNTTLETIAQTIFKEWFGKYQICDELPDGWRVGKLSEVGNVICGKTPSKSNKDYYGQEIPFIKIPDMHNQVFIINTSDNLSSAGADSQKNKTIPANSICVSCIATVGLVSLTTADSQTNQQINSIVPRCSYYREFLYLGLSKLNKYLNDLGSGGTATLNVNTSTFSSIELVLPSDNILKSFSKIQSPLFDKILSNMNQIQSLTKTRDTLLPKLMSGQVRVKM